MGAGTFWTLFYSMGYDLVELDEFKTGERREAIITALPQLVQKFGSAFGILMTGQLLSAYGYDSSKDVAGKESLITVVTDPDIISGMENNFHCYTGGVSCALHNCTHILSYDKEECKPPYVPA